MDRTQGKRRAFCVLVLCGLFFLFSTYICDSIRQSEQERVEQNANQVKSILDDTWDSMFNFGMSFMYSNVAKKLESAEDTGDFRSLGAYDLSSGISKQVTFEPMIADVVLYYPQSDILVGSKGVYTAHAYWTSVYGTGPDADEAHYARWYRALFSNRSSGYFATENGIFYRLSAENSNGRFLIAKISESALRERLAWINGTNNNSYVAVADHDGQILNYAGSYDLLAAAGPAALDSENGEYLISWRDGSAVGLKYLVVFEKSAAYRLSSTAKDISLGLLIAVFLLGVLASYLLLVRNVIPLERIAARLDNGTEQDVDAFELIDAGIDRLFEKRNEISTVARQQQILIGRTFLNELLFGEPSNQNQPETLAAIYGLTLESAQSMFVVRERSSDAGGMIPDCMLSSADDTLQAFWTERNHTDIFLFHYDPEAEDRIRNFIGRLREQSGPAHRVVCSKPTEDLTCLTECWLSCINQLGRTDLLSKRYRQSAAFHASPRQPVLDSFQYCIADKD